MQELNRRNFLKILGASGAALTQIGTLQHALAHRPDSTFLPISVAEREPYMHVISRLTFGATPELVERVKAIGVEAYIEEQLNPETIDDSYVENRLLELPDIALSAADLFEKYQGMGGGQAVGQLRASWALRATYSERQLYERMVHFWNDHFSIFIGNAQIGFLKVIDDRDVIRQHAMGRFRDLLGASAHSPAMLVYLNNAESTREAPNENYARELMELHSLGVDGGYTETDVKEVARAFTGWTVVPPRRRDRQTDGEIGTYWFNSEVHDDSEKVVLQQIISAKWW